MRNVRRNSSSIMMRAISILFATAALSGCSTVDTPYQRGASIHTGGQHFVCARHRIDFVTVEGFEFGQGCIMPTQEYSDLARFYPNAIGLYGSLSPTDVHKIWTQLTYCLRCEEELQQRLK